MVDLITTTTTTTTTTTLPPPPPTTTTTKKLWFETNKIYRQVSCSEMQSTRDRIKINK